MDHNISDLRLPVFNQSNTKVKYLYDALNSKGTAFMLSKKYNLQETIWLKFILTIGDIILGFYKVEDTVPLLQQELGLDPKTAALLGADVLEFLAPLSDPNWQPPVEETSDEITENSALPSIEQPRSVPVKAPAGSTAMTDATPLYTSPQPIHTFATDMAAVRGDMIPTAQSSQTYAPAKAPEPVYQSSQPTRSTLGEIPSYDTTTAPLPAKAPDTPTRPRWSTEL